MPPLTQTADAGVRTLRFAEEPFGATRKRERDDPSTSWTAQHSQQLWRGNLRLEFHRRAH